MKPRRSTKKYMRLRGKKQRREKKKISKGSPAPGEGSVAGRSAAQGGGVSGRGAGVSRYRGAGVSCASGACQVGVTACQVTGLRGPVKALPALVAWRNCELRSLRADGDLVQPRAHAEGMGAPRRCVEIVMDGWRAVSSGPLSVCPLLAVMRAHMCDIDDTHTEGPILGVEQGTAGGWGGWMG